MFFGAGNIIFPRIMGRTVEEGLLWALIGLILTAVLIPFAGLLSITLFKGNYESFFNRIGRIPGLIVIIILLAIIGPFGAIPRCITLTYSTLKIYFTSLHLFTFTIFSCLLIFFCSWKKSRILDIIGYVLSPLLILFLLAIIVKGIFFSSSEAVVGSQVAHPFIYGIKEGYNTMDLIAAFFFSSLVYQRLKHNVKEEEGSSRSLLLPIMKASLIGASLLSLVYIGFSYVAAHHSQALVGVPIDQLIGKIGQIVLGHYAGLIVSMSIALACLTTAIALTVVCAEFLQKRLTRGRLKYEWALVAILLVTVGVSTLEFTGIVRLLSPILEVIYPSLLVLSIFNVLHKVFAFRPVKFPVFTTFSLVLYFQHVA